MHNRNSRRKRRRKGDWKYIWRNYSWKLSKSKAYWYQDTGSTEGPNKLNTNRPTPRHVIIKTEKVKDKERIPKAAREKQSPLGYQLISLQKRYRPEGSGKIYLKC